MWTPEPQFDVDLESQLDVQSRIDEGDYRPPRGVLLYEAKYLSALDISLQWIVAPKLIC